MGCFSEFENKWQDRQNQIYQEGLKLGEHWRVIRKTCLQLGELEIYWIKIRNRNLGINCSEHFYNLSPTMDPINWKLKNQPFKNEKISKSNYPILKK